MFILIIFILKLNHFAPTVKTANKQSEKKKNRSWEDQKEAYYLPNFLTLRFPEGCDDVHSGCPKSRKHTAGKAHDQ